MKFILTSIYFFWFVFSSNAHTLKDSSNLFYQKNNYFKICPSFNYLLPDFASKRYEMGTVYRKPVAIITYGVEFNHGRRFARKSWFSFGFTYNQLSSRSSTDVVGAGGIDSKNSTSYTFIGCPIQYEYNLISSKMWSITCGVGLLGNILIANNYQVRTDNGFCLSEPAFLLKNKSLHALASIRFEVQVKKAIKLSFFVQYTHQITPMHVDPEWDQAWLNTKLKERLKYLSFGPALQIMF